ncbi:exodeoxyribonuclease V alpha chain [Ligilactobacillus acidipiscis DSM 15836]|uniref:ATP-dependent RecD2 DNA helicase n=1 Tax=Ligilactobacillus acidipiscis DSM 15836 TaxID=1423716 RepID=A0ABR5PM00_9LACO|nr:ATP-dependent RecD-like DNA helicase [Ligilactobacillus acidipiscis]KRM31173.1 exodeoxyribonuclease V alpha chain [Ligilactobacillus acidipiscis DSM 15836]GAW63464.1 exodeoxyribonuclease V subunit alpha [Ligilactobacillus acidipiscis]GEN20230.1 ATP-dependent RecD-like DNA helicase [Ligilactobacillus acidipiscis]
MVQQNIELFGTPQLRDEAFVVGQVAQVFFQSSANFYKVLLVKIKDKNFDWSESTITVTGNFADIKEETPYRFSGRLVKHPKYGQQFQADNYQTEIPSSKEGIVTYLSSSQFPGIGEKTAERIVQKLGNDAVSVLLQDPNKAKKLGLNEKQQKSLLDNLEADQGIEQIIIGLNSLGFSSNMAARIYSYFQEDTLNTIHDDPYQLSIHINGIGFYRADQIAEQLGFKPDDSGRLRGAIFHVLFEYSSSEGNTFVPGNILLQKVQQLLEEGRNVEIDPNKIADELIKLVDQRKLAVENNNFYLKKYFYGEWDIATQLARLMQEDSEQPLADEKQLTADLSQIETQMNIEYDLFQRDAITKALTSKVFLLTGGPGTGKTTIINAIVALYAYENDIDLEAKRLPILLAAPTGRAAKRMSEMTGLPASTIHRLLGINGHEEQLPEEVDELDGTLLIIDETSMVDTDLMKILLKSIPDAMQVIFVGDRHQLPSVGPGQVFADMLASDLLPKKELTKIYRQGEYSSIISLAHAVNQGELPVDFSQQQNDRSFIRCTAKQVPQVIAQVIEVALRKGNSKDDIQVLAPMYRGPAGIDSLNDLLQEIMNPHHTRQKEIEVRGHHLRIGDRVLQLVNDPENNIYNGDIGKIVAIDIGDKGQKAGPDSVTISFEQNEVEVEKKDWNNLTLAYCLSIHKSQGGEFPIVILPMVPQFARMFARNLLYTAITRAKEKLILVGDLESFRRSISKVAQNRLTTLKQRLETELGDEKQVGANDDSTQLTQPAVQVERDGSQPKKTKQDGTLGKNTAEEFNQRQVLNESYTLTLQLIESQNIDPMIGMDGVRPIDFMSQK